MTTTTTATEHTDSRLGPGATGRGPRLAWALAVAAPLVAEFVSGNLPIVFLPLLVVYVPLYGGAAVLIREVARRTRRPWPVAITLGLAYGVAEEAFVSFSLFNRDYAGLRLLDFGWIPWAGTGAWWAVFVVVLHMVWSICVPIVLIESVAGDLSDRPWLTWRGMCTAAVAMLGGGAAAAGLTLAEDDFLPTAPQLVVSAAVVAGLVVAAVTLGRVPHAGEVGDEVGAADRGEATHLAPPPRSVALGAGAAATVFMAGTAQAGPPALTVGGYLLLFAVVTVVLVHCARRPGWGPRHRLALATGALVPHVGFALLVPPLVDVPAAVAWTGDIVFTGALVYFLAQAWRS